MISGVDCLISAVKKRGNPVANSNRVATKRATKRVQWQLQTSLDNTTKEIINCWSFSLFLSFLLILLFLFILLRLLNPLLNLITSDMRKHTLLRLYIDTLWTSNPCLWDEDYADGFLCLGMRFSQKGVLARTLNWQ